MMLSWSPHKLSALVPCIARAPEMLHKPIDFSLVHCPEHHRSYCRMTGMSFSGVEMVQVKRDFGCLHMMNKGQCSVASVPHNYSVGIVMHKCYSAGSLLQVS